MSARSHDIGLLTVGAGHSQGFQESEITFGPTFKLYPNSAAYNTARTPSYTDRILWRQMPQQSTICCEPVAYESLISVDMSDHRPVSATFNLHVLPPTSCHLYRKSVR
jgi:hypothetical protein